MAAAAAAGVQARCIARAPSRAPVGRGRHQDLLHDASGAAGAATGPRGWPGPLPSPRRLADGSNTSGDPQFDAIRAWGRVQPPALWQGRSTKAGLKGQKAKGLITAAAPAQASCQTTSEPRQTSSYKQLASNAAPRQTASGHPLRSSVKVGTTRRAPRLRAASAAVWPAPAPPPPPSAPPLLTCQPTCLPCAGDSASTGMARYVPPNLPPPPVEEEPEDQVRAGAAPTGALATLQRLWIPMSRQSSWPQLLLLRHTELHLCTCAVSSCPSVGPGGLWR